MHVTLVYGPPFDVSAALDDPLELLDVTFEEWLDIYLLPADCARQADSRPFVPGEYGELPVRSTHGALEVLVGDTVVEIDTSYDGERLAAMVGSIQPFDLDAEITRLSVVAEQLWNDPEAFGAALWPGP